MTAVRVTWWGHATCTVDIGGVALLTDPVLTPRLAHLRRVDAPVPPASAGRADAVLVSHLHLDHFHLPSLRLVEGGELVLPGGSHTLLARSRAWPVRPVHEMWPGASLQFGSVTVRAVHARHDGRRLPTSTVHGPALGYLVEHDGVRVWFAGDTGLFDDMSALGPVDIAVVPVGGWGPTLGDEHLSPAQAAEAVARVGARHAVPVHYGTFWPVGLRHVQPAGFRTMFREPGDRFAKAVADRGLTTQVHLLACGESADVDV